MSWYDAPKHRDHPHVEAYLADATDAQREILTQVRDHLKRDATVLEFIAWGVPCYWRKGPLVYTSAAKNHVTLGFFHGMEIGSGLEGTGKSPVAKYVWKLGAPPPDRFEHWIAGALAVDDAGDEEEE